MANKYRKYNIAVNTYDTSKSIVIIDKCNGFTLTNIGAVACRVNGMVLFPSAIPATVLGDSRSIGGNEGEIYKGNIEISFAAGAGPLLEVVQKFYIDNDNLE